MLTDKRSSNLVAARWVAHTNGVRSQDLVVSYKLGVYAYVVKPESLQDFIKAVKQLSILGDL